MLHFFLGAVFSDCDFNPTLRPEPISPEGFVKIANAVFTEL